MGVKDTILQGVQHFCKKHGMKTIETHISPDGALTLIVVEGNDGTIAIGFEGGDWHTHPSLIGYWLPVAEPDAVKFFIEAVVGDRLPILFKANSSDMSDAWISDNLIETLRHSDDDEWRFRLWSGAVIDAEQALAAYANAARPT